MAITGARSPLSAAAGARISLPRELVVLSHLRWPSGWQRPQELISRLARGRHVWFVEEPLAVEAHSRPRVRTERDGSVVRVWLEVPGPARHVGFCDPAAGDYPALLRELVGPYEDRAAWLYTPSALPFVDALEPRLVVYDVLDDPAAGKGAPPELALCHRRLLGNADLVLTGSRSVQRSVVRRRPEAHCVSSGVDTAHYRRAIRLRSPEGRRVAGYAGVIDQRLDLDLIAELAAALADWEIRMVGPVAGIDRRSLPRSANMTYTGQVRYADLPAVMAGFDVALMPFAHKATTPPISPTMALEYLAAGLPVVSTRVPDVVDMYSDVVELEDDGRSFAAACRRAVDHCPVTLAARAQPLLKWHQWDTITERIAELVAGAAVAKGTVTTGRKP